MTSENYFDKLELVSATRNTIAYDLFDKIRTDILNGTLPPGYVFPNENDLCQKLNIGRSTLREAYSSLETLNLITRRKTGTCVNSTTETGSIMNFEEIARICDTATLMEYRSVMEVSIIQNAAMKANASDIEELRTILEHMKEVLEDAATLSQYDYDFHARIAAITRNKLLMITFSTIRSIYEEFTERMFESGAYELSVDDHSRIIDALEARNPQLAGEMMYRHLSNVQNLVNTLEK